MHASSHSGSNCTMNFFLLLVFTVAIACLPATFLLGKAWMNKSKKTKNHEISEGYGKEAPEAPGRWPIIGHIHLLLGTTPPHRVLAALADGYGPVFTLRIGLSRTLVVSSWELAKECFTTNDRAFATRPYIPASKLMGYEDAIFGLAPYGSYWRNVRKIATLQLLSTRMVDTLKHVRALEVSMCVRDMFCMWKDNGQSTVRIEMKQVLEDLTFNVVMQTVTGKRYFGRDVPEAVTNEACRFRLLVEEFFYHLWASGMYAVPFLEKFDFKGHVRATKKVASGIDRIIQSWIDEHRRRNDSDRRQNFINVLLSAIGNGEITGVHEAEADTIVKATLLSIIIAAIETTSTTMAWALALLLKNRHMLQKVHDELDVHVGKERIVNESDIVNLKYVQAVVKETLRLYPPAPFLLPHEAMEDCHIGNHKVKRGTRLFVNAWKIHRDPRVWPDPEEFQPERFIVGNLHSEKNLEIIAFGLGRRSCPGMGFALQSMHLALASLLHSFDLESPPDAMVDLEEGMGMSLYKLNPLQVDLTPRLPL